MNYWCSRFAWALFSFTYNSTSPTQGRFYLKD
nr:MAG TPA: hypothetical protein [Caudoviricetes sp.]